jgi:hypothetical protein
MTDAIAQKIVERLGKAKSNRLNWESYWQEVSELVLPNMSNTFFEGGYSLTQAQKKDQKRFDGSAEIAATRLASTMESLLTPRNSRWHGISTDNPNLNKLRRVREWQDTTTDILFKHRYSSQANFGSQAFEHYLSVGVLGTGCMFVDKLLPRGFRYAQIHVAQVYFYENHQGIVDEALRPFKLTAKQAAQKFGEDNLPDDIKKAVKESPEQQFDFIHCVMPREDRDYNRKDFKGMAFGSYYVARNSAKVVMEEGYNTFPYAISRYITAPGELYGRSPAMQALTNIKVLNEQKKTMLKQGHRAVDPVILAHDDGVMDSFSLKPGAINTGAMTGDGKRLVDVLPVGNIAVGDKMMQMERDEISAAFMTDLFAIFMERPQMTATEIVELAREKGVLFSPIMGRQESEFLSVMIEREMDLANQQLLLPPMPPELIEAQGEYKITFDNPLSRAQKAEQAAGLMRTVDWAANMAAQSQDPTPLDHFEWDVIVPELSHINGVPASWMKSPERLAEMRKGRQQAAETQQVIDAGPTIAALQKNAQ